MKKILILGSTGSIGRSTADIIRNNRRDFRVLGITGNSNYRALISQARALSPAFVVTVEKKNEAIIRQNISTGIKVISGKEGLLEAVSSVNTDLTVSAISGYSGILPTFEAIKKTKTLAIANKEVIVSCGVLFKAETARRGVHVLPVDSEHSAIFQCLEGEDPDNIEKVIITASGGPFHSLPGYKMRGITPEAALRHPTWKMGKKVTIDSSTLANKGMEVIEAHYLFNLPYEKIDVLIHRQSVIHSIVEFRDGSSLAQMAVSDMRVPIQYALYYPERRRNRIVKKLKLSEIRTLTFDRPDMKKFPLLALAYRAGRKGMSFPAVFSAANEESVNAFLRGSIRFTDIADITGKVLSAHRPEKIKSPEDAMGVVRKARQSASEIISDRALK